MIWVETVRVCESVEMDRRVFEEGEVEDRTIEQHCRRSLLASLLNTSVEDTLRSESS